MPELECGTPARGMADRARRQRRPLPRHVRRHRRRARRRPAARLAGIRRALGRALGRVLSYAVAGAVVGLVGAAAVTTLFGANGLVVLRMAAAC